MNLHIIFKYLFELELTYQAQVGYTPSEERDSTADNNSALTLQVHTLCTMLNLALPHFLIDIYCCMKLAKHLTQQMNDFSYTVKTETIINHSAIKLLTVTALQPVDWPINVILFAVMWMCYIFFRISSSFLPLSFTYTCNQDFWGFIPLCVVRAYHKVTSLPVWPGIITPNWKAIDQRADETTKAAWDNWPSLSHENQKLTWPWSWQTWKARRDQCNTVRANIRAQHFTWRQHKVCMKSKKDTRNSWAYLIYWHS